MEVDRGCMRVPMNDYVYPNFLCNFPELLDITSGSKLGAMKKKNVEFIKLYLFVKVVLAAVVHVPNNNEASWQGRERRPHLRFSHKIAGY